MKDKKNMIEFKEKFKNGYHTHCIIEVDDVIVQEFDIATSSFEGLAFTLQCINDKVKKLKFNQQKAFWVNNGTYEDFAKLVGKI